MKKQEKHSKTLSFAAFFGKSVCNASVLSQKLQIQRNEFFDTMQVLQDML